MNTTKHSFYIYITTNKINGHTYVGQKSLRNGETPETDNYLGSGDNLLYKAIPKYGRENFYKTVLEYCDTKKEADILEKKWISHYRSIGKAEYNIANGGQGGNLGEEVNKRISHALKGKPTWTKGAHFTEEHKNNLRKSNLGKKRSAEARLHNSLAQKGKHYSEEYKKKMSEIKKKWAEEHPEVYAEIGRKCSEKLKGRKPNEITRKRMSESAKLRPSNVKGKKWYNNGEINIAANECPEGFVLGRLTTYKHSEESRNKMKQAAKGRRHYNNGIIEVYSTTCPEGFVPGRLTKNKHRKWYNNGKINILSESCPEGFVKGMLKKD